MRKAPVSCVVCTSQSPECVPERPSRLLWPLAFGRGRCPFGSLEAVADFVHFLDDFVRPQDLTRRDPARKPLKQDLMSYWAKGGGLAAYSGRLTKLRTHFTFRVDTWIPDGESI